MRLILLNNTAQSYLNVWEELKEVMELKDIPLDVVPEVIVAYHMSEAIDEAESGITSPLYDAMLSALPQRFIEADNTVTVSMSMNSSFKLCLNEEDTIHLPYLTYTIWPLNKEKP